MVGEGRVGREEVRRGREKDEREGECLILR